MRNAFVLAGCLFLSGCASLPSPAPSSAQQVIDTERAFARTMAIRDYAAFVSFLAEDAVFFSGSRSLRGRARVAEAWKPYFERATAPFSWEPEQVEVLESGGLALSSGPVRDQSNKLVGTFTSIWRLEAPGVWRIVFDKGNDTCDCTKP